MDRVGAGLRPGSRARRCRRSSPGSSGAEGEGVGLRRLGAGGRRLVEVARVDARRQQLRVVRSRGSRPGGWDRRGRPGRSAARTSRSAFASPVKIVTARSGSARRRCSRSRARGRWSRARRCSVGNFAVATSTGNSPAGSSASWRSSSPPQAAQADGSDATDGERDREPCRARPERRGGRALVALSSPKARGTYHRRRSTSGPARRLPAAPARRLWVADARAIEYSSRLSLPAVGREPEEKMVRSVADRAFLPAKIAVRAGREHDDPDRQDDHRDGQAALPLRRRVHRASSSSRSSSAGSR